MKRLFADSALVEFSEFCPLIGIKLKEEKSEACPDITFLGLRASFPSFASRFELSVRLGDNKRTAWLALADHFLKTKSISHQQLEKLICRLSFSKTILFGKFARAQLRPLYKNTHRMFYCGNLHRLEISNLSWRMAILASMEARTLSPRPSRIRWISYTAAATTSSILFALLFDAPSSRPTIQC